MSTQDEVLRECRDKLARGAMVEDVIRALRDGGFSKVHSIKALVDLGQANMNEAKHIVHNSPTWADVRERDEAFHRKLDE
ncbi:MAG TPA: hypothetical protein VJA26_11180 [Gammaproteobacteria bacterium]|nr:hypothetical protein [Gammaproteobacteria bacterium]